MGSKIAEALKEAVNHADLDHFIHESLREIGARIAAEGFEWYDLEVKMWPKLGQLPRALSLRGGK